MVRSSFGQSDWECSFWPEGDIDGPRPGVWIRATSGSHVASLFRIDLAGEVKNGTIIVCDNKGREVHRAPWAGSQVK
jgi:hypothetical protein